MLAFLLFLNGAFQVFTNSIHCFPHLTIVILNRSIYASHCAGPRQIKVWERGCLTVNEVQYSAISERVHSLAESWERLLQYDLIKDPKIYISDRSN